MTRMSLIMAEAMITMTMTTSLTFDCNCHVIICIPSLSCVEPTLFTCLCTHVIPKTFCCVNIVIKIIQQTICIKLVITNFIYNKGTLRRVISIFVLNIISSLDMLYCSSDKLFMPVQRTRYHTSSSHKMRSCLVFHETGF